MQELLSPAAISHWPMAARQLRDAGVLNAVDAISLAAYCEAFARWCAAGEQVARMLIDFGVRSGRKAQVQTGALEKPMRSASIEAGVTEPVRRARNAIMRRDEVERETGLSHSTIYKRIKDGTFPAPLKIGPGSTGWRVTDIEAFLASPADYRVESCASQGQEGLP
ncbi:AlpA family phage regulatory protein [Paraburkholderia atlantica]|uniref:AlpA family phage regulatory protein n=1 Tax=Paraburkholderia atlantica TaxID=2654982 RepID=UPI0012FF1C1F